MPDPARLRPVAPWLVVALLCATALPGRAYIRLVFPDNGTPLRWASLPIRYRIDPDGSDDITDGSDLTAVRSAFRTWASIPGSRIAFEEQSPPAGARAVHRNDGLNWVVFDETNETGLFTGQPQIIAITPVFFDSAGRLLDADIVFNGRDHTFSTDLRANTFDVRNIATHEVGHLLGLDHTGIYGATLMPFAFQQDDRLRSLAEDEYAAARAIYPDPGAAIGAVEGQIAHDSGRPVDSAHVVLTDAVTGETAASARTSADGRFHVGGLAPGTYTLFAEPLDGPTSQDQLQLPVPDTAFGTGWYGGNASRSTLTIQPGQTLQLGTLRMPPSSGRNLTGVSPYAVRRGTTVTLTLSGTGLSAGLEVEIPGPGIEVFGLPDPNRGLLGSGGAVTVRIDASAPPGVRDIYVYEGSGAARSMVALAGGFEIRAAPPRITGLSPTSGPVAGASRVTITGAEFAPGIEVRFGGSAATSVTWRSAGTIEALAPPHPPGLVAVTVINPDGQQARRDAVFLYTGRPRLDRVEPAHGPTAGGVTVQLHGAQLATGAQVLFGGVPAHAVQVAADGASLQCVAPAAGTPGAVDVTVRNPDGTSDTLASGYTYRVPSLLAVLPDVGSVAGGAPLRLLGDDLPPGSTVSLGGSTASGVQFVAIDELRLVAPPHAAGTVDIAVRTPDGRTATLPAAFRYVRDPQPVIRSIQPASGPDSGGTAITILGDAFEPTASVEIGGRPAQAVQVLSPTEIAATTPPGSAGAADVVVRNASGLEARAFGGFAYTASRSNTASGASASSSGSRSFGFCRFEPDAHDRPVAALLPWLVLLALGVLARSRARLAEAVHGRR